MSVAIQDLDLYFWTMKAAHLRQRLRLSAIALLHLAHGCAGGSSDAPVVTGDAQGTPATCDADVVHTLTPDPEATGETYLCYGFEARSLVDRTIQGLVWHAPTGGGVTWHHATLSAVPGDFPDGPIPCDGLPPGSVSLHVWAPGGDNLLLPEATGLVLPETTNRLAVELHVLRADLAPAATGSLGICMSHDPVRNFARFFSVAAPIPARRPRTQETASTKCTFEASAHLWSIWPH